MVQRFGPLMNEGGAAISLTYIASERIIPGWPTPTFNSYQARADSIYGHKRLASCASCTNSTCAGSLELFTLLYTAGHDLCFQA